MLNTCKNVISLLLDILSRLFKSMWMRYPQDVNEDKMDKWLALVSAKNILSTIFAEMSSNIATSIKTIGQP